MPGESSGGSSVLGPVLWFGGKLLGGIFGKKGMSASDRAKLDDFRRRAGETLRPKPPPTAQPVVPQPPTIEQATAPRAARNEPKRGRARKAKGKKVDPTAPVTWEQVSPFVYDAYARAIQGGFGGGAAARSRGAYNAPPMGSRSAQRGFVGSVGSGPMAAARTVGQQRAAAGAVRSAPMAAPTAPGARAEFDPKWGEELEPAVAPGGAEPLQPVKVPKRWTSDIAPIEVPERVKYGQPGTGTTASQQVRARSGPAPAMPGTGGKSQPAGRPAGGTAPGRGTKGIPRATARAPVLSLDALLSPIVRSLTKRTPTQRPAMPGLGSTSSVPGTRPGTAPQTAPLGNTLGPSSTSDSCDCSSGKKKPSKPRKPRSECWKGSYIETAKGIKKTRREQVSC